MYIDFLKGPIIFIDRLDICDSNTFIFVTVKANESIILIF